MIGFCCTDHIESLRLGRRVLQLHRKLQEMLTSSKKMLWKGSLSILTTTKVSDLGVKRYERERDANDLKLANHQHHTITTYIKIFSSIFVHLSSDSLRILIFGSNFFYIFMKCLICVCLTLVQ